VAQRIAAGLRTSQYDVDLCNIKDQEPPSIDEYSLLGIGAPVYYFRPPFTVIDYLDSLPSLDGVSVFVFMLHGTYKGDAGTFIRQALTRKKAREVGYFHCYGADYFLGYLKKGYLFSPDHPTQTELAQAETFGREVASRCAGKQYVRRKDELSPPLLYRLERSLTNRWLVSQIQSRLFRVDATKCTGCGLCVELCPMKNITDTDGHPVWGQNCLLCFTCHMKCPEEAITSPVSWVRFPPFRFLMDYNVRKASQDPSIDHVRVIHSNGRTEQCEGE
jgi:ferredoxin/flavodoxin